MSMDPNVGSAFRLPIQTRAPHVRHKFDHVAKSDHLSSCKSCNYSHTLFCLCDFIIKNILSTAIKSCLLPRLHNVIKLARRALRRVLIKPAQEYTLQWHSSSRIHQTFIKHTNSWRDQRVLVECLQYLNPSFSSQLYRVYGIRAVCVVGLNDRQN